MILNFLASLLIRQDALQSADIVVALGGGTPCLRQDYAAEIYRQGLARKLLISGLPVVWGAGAEKTVRQHFINLGIPDTDLVFADDTGNTLVEAETIAQLMRAKGWKSALVVTDQFHTRRATYSCERAAPDLTFYAAPLPDRISLWKHTRWWTRRGDTAMWNAAARPRR